MDKENFRLFEGQGRRKSAIHDFDAPLSVGLVFDASGSMGQKLVQSRQAAAQFFKTANPEDEFSIQFNDRPQMVVGLYARHRGDLDALTFTQAKGRAPLLDGARRSPICAREESAQGDPRHLRRAIIRPLPNPKSQPAQGGRRAALCDQRLRDR
ncbi:MAG: hypothetical protein HS123_16045 [Solibacteraceae bacterium]|nr:hypothetical protein [Solibacteraceae bacterium]